MENLTPSGFEPFGLQQFAIPIMLSQLPLKDGGGNIFLLFWACVSSNIQVVLCTTEFCKLSEPTGSDF